MLRVALVSWWDALILAGLGSGFIGSDRFRDCQSSPGWIEMFSLKQFMEPDGVGPFLNRTALLRHFLSKNGVLSSTRLFLEPDDVLRRQLLEEG